MLRPPTLFLVWLATAELVQTTDPCPTNRSGRMRLYGQSCYEFDDNRVNWTNAQRTCQQRMGRLVFIPNAETQSWLGSAAANIWSNQNLVWIGLNKPLSGRNFTWDDYNGTAQLGSFYSWQSASSSSSNGCVAMYKFSRWRWTVVSCSLSYTFVCEYPAAAMIASVTVLAKSTEPTMLDNRSSSAAVNSPNDLALVTSFAGITNTTMGKDHEKGLVLTLSISICVFLFVAASVLIAVFLYRRKRHSKHSISAEHQDTLAIHVVNNASYATGVDPDGPTLEPGHAIDKPLNSGYTYIGEMPETEIVAYAESFDDLGHTYAEPLEPWPSSGGSIDRRAISNEKQPVLRGSANGHSGITGVENEPLVVHMSRAPTEPVRCTAVPTEDVYMEMDPLVSSSSNADRSLPCSSAAYQCLSDCQSNDCLTDTYVIE